MTNEGGSELCLACGLCCQGVLHDDVRLPIGERDSARRLRLPVVPRDGEVAFDLPCRHHGASGCGIYADRPSTCRSYRCKLLNRYLRGETSREEALALIARARRLVAAVRRQAGGDARASVWRQVRARLAGRSETGATESREVAPELLLDVGELLALCRGHFKNRFDNPLDAPAGSGGAK